MRLKRELQRCIREKNNFTLIIFVKKNEQNIKIPTYDLLLFTYDLKQDLKTLTECVQKC